jgi:hypothetical protein
VTNLLLTQRQLKQFLLQDLVPTADSITNAWIGCNLANVRHPDTNSRNSSLSPHPATPVQFCDLEEIAEGEFVKVDNGIMGHITLREVREVSILSSSNLKVSKM